MAAPPKGKKPEPHKSPPAKPAATKKAAGVAASVRPRGRPSPYAGRRSEIMGSVCEQIAKGVTMADICRQAGMPDRQTIYEWSVADADFALRIARARDEGADVIAEQSLAIVDAPPERGPDGKIDAGSVAHAKLRAEHRLKLLAKWNPKKYGDKVAIGGADDLGPVQTVAKEMTDAERAVRLSRAINDNPAALQALLAAIAKKGAAK